MKQQRASTDSDMPRNWPNPGWPGCPGPGRYRAARKTYATHLAALSQNDRETEEEEEGENKRASPPDPPAGGEAESPGARRARLDLQIVTDLEAGYWECERYNSADTLLEYTRPVDPGCSDTSCPDTGYPDLINPMEFENPAQFARNLSTRTIIGLLIIKTGSQGLDVGCSILSRHHRWMGLCPYLEDMKGADVIIECQGHRPSLVTAIPGGHFQHPDPDMLPCPRGEKMLAGREAKFLERIVRFHGGAPVFMDLCGKNLERWNRGELIIRVVSRDEENTQERYAFHNGPVNNWRN